MPNSNSNFNANDGEAPAPSPAPAPSLPTYYTYDASGEFLDSIQSSYQPGNSTELLPPQAYSWERRYFQNGAWQTAYKQNTLLLVDSEVDSIISLAIGNRAVEYQTAETEAQAYLDLGYTGPVPLSVSTWAIPSGITNQQATDSILAQAAAWRGAQGTLRGLRLATKAAIRAAAGDKLVINAALQSFYQNLFAIRTQLGV
jgi:hypothetical protein